MTALFIWGSISSAQKGGVALLQTPLWINQTFSTVLGKVFGHNKRYHLSVHSVGKSTCVLISISISVKSTTAVCCAYILSSALCIIRSSDDITKIPWFHPAIISSVKNTSPQWPHILAWGTLPSHPSIPSHPLFRYFLSMHPSPPHPALPSDCLLHWEASSVSPSLLCIHCVAMRV